MPAAGYNKQPLVMTPALFETLKALRAKGKSFRLCADLTGIGLGTAYKWLKGKRTFKGQRLIV